MKILAIGDVTSSAGAEHLKNNLWRIRRELGVDFCVVNGENASFISSISPETADMLLRSGADVITGGNHAYFGMYGEQKNDGEATITNIEQINITAQKIAEFINK